MPSGFMPSPVYCRIFGQRAIWIIDQSDSHKFIVLEVCNDLLRESLGTLLERRNAIRVGGGELLLNGLHVALQTNASGLVCLRINGRQDLEVREVSLFVEGG